MAARRAGYLVACLILCGTALAQVDSTAIKKLDVQIANYKAAGDAMVQQREQLNSALLRLEGVLFILQEQRKDEVARLDSLAKKQPPLKKP